jgi:hypothetical protein
MLDSENISDLVSDLSPYVTNAIWIGKLNDPRRRIEIGDDAMAAAVDKIEKGQTDDRIFAIYESFRANPLIKWKESIKKVVDIELPDQPGLDE